MALGAKADHFRNGSIASFVSLAGDSRPSRGSGHRYCRSACLKSAQFRPHAAQQDWSRV